MKDLRDAVALIATPEYAFAGCEARAIAALSSAGRADPRRRLELFRGAIAAVNGWDSNTGMNLFRATIAPVARRAPFFRSIVVTGSHLASLEAVADGRADLAAIDCVTYGLVKRFCGGLIDRTAIVAESPLSPGLPFIASARLPDRTIVAVREALFAALADPASPSRAASSASTGARLTTSADYGEFSRSSGTRSGRLSASRVRRFVTGTGAARVRRRRFRSRTTRKRSPPVGGASVEFILPRRMTHP